jgi:hypothetical protein
MQPRFLAVSSRVAGAILITTAIALVVVSLLLIRLDGAISPRNLLFWATPLALAALLLAGLRLRALRRIQLVLMGLSVAVSLYAVELFLYVAATGAATYLLPIETRMSNDAKMEARVFCPALRRRLRHAHPSRVHH